MSAASSPLARFLRAIRRRQLVLRIFERGGLCLLGGCFVAAALVAVEIWRGDDGSAIAGLTLVAGALVGGAWGVLDRPDVFSAAVEADRQLRTADLFATAWMLGQRRNLSADEAAWTQTVSAMAEGRCRQHRPSEVILHKLGVRAWIGIAVAVTFVATLAALSSRSPEAVAADADGTALSRATDQRSGDSQRPIVELAVGSGSRQPRVDLSLEESAKNNAGSGDTRATNDRTENPHDAPAQRHPNNSASSPGTGQGPSTSPMPPRPAKSPVPRRQDITTSANHVNGRDARPSSAGTGRVTNVDSPPEESTSTGDGVVARNDRVTPRRSAETPWSKNDWPQTVESARRAVSSGHVPDEARDLVRAYFDVAADGP